MDKIMRTPEERRALVGKIEALKKSGLTVNAAEKELGLGQNQYYSFKNSLKKKPRVTASVVMMEPKPKRRKKRTAGPTLTDIPIPQMKHPATQVFVMFGEPRVVADAIRSLQ
jgi:hypothetical protein